MSREFEFRFWNGEQMLSTWDMTLEAFFASYESPSNEKLPLMQFTGLRDVNGVEIYEGDILKQYHFSDAKGKKHYLRHKVVWSYKYDGWLCVDCKSDNENDGSCQLWVYSKTPFTVDGNIYEHPHLLDGSK